MSTQTPLISRLTKYLGVRRNKMWLRYKDDISPRSIPKPKIPPGANAKLAANYYFTRDERRKAAPPLIIASAIHSVTPRLEAGTSEEASTETKEVTNAKQDVKLPTPGFPTKWTLSTDQPYLRH